LEEGGIRLADALRKASEGQRSPAEVRHDRVGDTGVVVDHLRLAGPRLRVEDLVEVGQLQLAPADGDFLIALLRRDRQRWPLSLGLLARAALLAAVRARGLCLRGRLLG